MISMSIEDPDERTLPTSLPREAVDGAVAEMGLDLERIYKLESEGVMGRIIVKDSEGAIVLQRGELCSILGSPIVIFLSELHSGKIFIILYSKMLMIDGYW